MHAMDDEIAGMRFPVTMRGSFKTSEFRGIRTRPFCVECQDWIYIPEDVESVEAHDEKYHRELAR